MKTTLQCMKTILLRMKTTLEHMKTTFLRMKTTLQRMKTIFPPMETTLQCMTTILLRTKTTLEHMRLADQRMKSALLREHSALMAKEEAESSMRQQLAGLRAMGSLTAMRAAAFRAKACAQKLLQLRAEGPAQVEEEPNVEGEVTVDKRHPPAEDSEENPPPLVVEDSIEMLPMETLVEKLDGCIGPTEGWVGGYKSEDAALAERVLERMCAMLKRKDKEAKAIRKVAVENSLFDVLGEAMRKFADEPLLPTKADRDEFMQLVKKVAKLTTDHGQKFVVLNEITLEEYKLAK